MKDPKDVFSEKNPCGLVKAAVPEGLIGHFQPRKPQGSCMKMGILNSLYEPIWLKLSSILKRTPQFANVVRDCDSLSSHESDVLSPLSKCWKATKWWILWYSLISELNDCIFSITSRYWLSGNSKVRIWAKHWNAHIWENIPQLSSETQDSLVRIHRLSFRFCNAKHLVVKALVLSRLDDQSIQRLHFEQYNVQSNDRSLHWCFCGKHADVLSFPASTPNDLKAENEAAETCVPGFWKLNGFTVWDFTSLITKYRRYHDPDN